MDENDPQKVLDACREIRKQLGFLKDAGLDSIHAGIELRVDMAEKVIRAVQRRFDRVETTSERHERILNNEEHGR